MNIFVKCWECWDVGDAENVGNGNIYLCFFFFCMDMASKK